MTSAAGCNSPKGPTRLGPGRSWMRPAPRRSTQRRMGSSPRMTPSGTSTRSARIVQSAAVIGSGGPGDRKVPRYDYSDTFLEPSDRHEKALLHDAAAVELRLGDV